jgi:hypothetical protein
MNKRLVAKLTVTVAALSAMTLLQGCSSEVNSAVVSAAWMPFGSQPPLGTEFVPIGSAGAGAAASAGQSAATATASAVASAAGGGGGQVSQ